MRQLTFGATLAAITLGAAAAIQVTPAAIAMLRGFVSFVVCASDPLAIKKNFITSRPQFKNDCGLPDPRRRGAP